MSPVNSTASSFLIKRPSLLLGYLSTSASVTAFRVLLSPAGGAGVFSNVAMWVEVVRLR